MKITKRKEHTPAGDINLFIIENACGAWVELSSLGAGVTAVCVPDREGRIEHVALGYADIASYVHDDPNMGKTAGRYANRIAHGALTVGGRSYKLAVNCGSHHLHGGPEGFQHRLWSARELSDGVVFTYRSVDGEEHYPGTLEVRVTYHWSDDMRLSIEYSAVTDEDTVVNLTNHCYWNLRGADAGCALGHELQMKASRCLVTDETLAPTGEFDDVAGTPMDFRSFKTLGKDIHADFAPLRHGKGYDHCWAIDDWQPGMMAEDVVVLRDPVSGRTLAVDSDQPGVQIYTGNWLAGSGPNGSGGRYADYDGVAVEMQGFPDAPNHGHFPSQLIHPGEEYVRRIHYKFGVM